jgi:hypothetical protein
LEKSKRPIDEAGYEELDFSDFEFELDHLSDDLDDIRFDEQDLDQLALYSPHTVQNINITSETASF